MRPNINYNYSLSFVLSKTESCSCHNKLKHITKAANSWNHSSNEQGRGISNRDKQKYLSKEVELAGSLLVFTLKISKAYRLSTENCR
jgi:squalene cyclase